MQATITNIDNDLRQAIYVFPNGEVPGVTDKPPYNNLPPYFRSLSTTALQGACGTATEVQNWSNRARIDMVQVRRTPAGAVETPLAPAYTIVTYYSRRQNMNAAYDPIDNPIALYRAEYPAFGLYQPKAAGAAQPVAKPLEVTTPKNALNAKVDFTRFAAGTTANSPECTADKMAGNRSSLWLTHNFYGEADLSLLTTPAVADGFTVSSELYSNTIATPRGLALEASRAYRSLPVPAGEPPLNVITEAPLVPDTSFTESDSNGDGKIDRVTISLGLASFDVGAQGEINKNNQPTGTRLRATRTVDLPNIQ